MARFYRRRRYRYRPRKYVRRYFKRRFRRFVNGSSRSMIRVKIPHVFSTTSTQLAATQGTTPIAICNPFCHSSYAISPIKSNLYRAYCNLYEEVKCIGVKAQVNVCSQVGGTDIPSLLVYTATDRRFGHGESEPSFSEMSTYSTYNVVQAVNNSVAKLQRSVYASDLMEKAQWHDCTLREHPTTTVPPGDGYVHDDAYEAAGANVNFFCPAMFLAFAVPQKATQTQIDFTVSLVYYFAFRNPKYGASASLSRAAIAAAAAEAPDVVMDADPVLDAPEAEDLSAPAALDVRSRSLNSEELQLATAPLSKTRRVDPGPKNV